MQLSGGPAELLTPDRFADRTRALAGADWTEDARIAVAVSGGPDSLALLKLAHEAFGSAVCALTFDHGFRAASAEEAEAVAALCASIGVPHHILRPAASLPVANLHHHARAARLAAMGGWCAAQGIRWLLLAQHADDQAETLLMRLSRGAGVAGLSGIRARLRLDGGVAVLRPLLAWRKADLRAVVKAAGWEAVEDPSNADPRFDRTAARSLLADAEWIDPHRLAASAHHLSEAEAALDWLQEELWRTRVRADAAEIRIDREALPDEMVRRLLARAIMEMSGHAPRGEAVARLLNGFAKGRRTIGAALVTATAERLTVTPAPPRR